jgi:hypothetical protein
MDTSTTIKVLTTLGLIEITLSHPVLVAFFLTVNFIIGRLDGGQKDSIIKLIKSSDFDVKTLIKLVGAFFGFLKVLEDKVESADYLAKMDEAEKSAENEKI